MRREVREVEMKSHLALVQRIKRKQINLKALPETDVDQRNAKLTAIAQTETTLTQLESTAPIGRVVIHSSRISSAGATPRQMWRCAMATCS